MKKAYVAMFLLSAVVLTGCAFNEQKVTEVITNEIAETADIAIQEAADLNVPIPKREELPSEFDAGKVPTVEGSENVNVNKGLSAKVDEMIDQRNTQPQDASKLTEEDIDLMQQIIDKIKNMAQ